MTHTLIHWRYHLNEWVTDYLERKGYFEDSKVVERNQWSQKKKSRYANEVVDMMDETGEVQSLWRDFHLNMKAARETKVGRNHLQPSIRKKNNKSQSSMLIVYYFIIQEGLW